MSDQTPQQPGWGPPPTPPKQRSAAFKAGFLGCFGVAAAVVVVIVVVAVIASSGSKSTNTPASADQAAGTTAPAQKAANTRPAGTVLLSVKGSGTKTTKKFSAASDWDLAWSYDCSGFGSQGNFIVTVNASDPLSEAALLTPVNQLGRHGSGVEHYHAGGNGIWLEVNSECSWSIKAVVA